MQNQTAPNHNEVTSFVHRWFALYDRMVAGLSIAALLTDDVKIAFFDQKQTSSAEFAAYYEGRLPLLATVDHRVESIEVTPKTGGADVVTQVQYTATDAQGRTVSLKVQQTWRLI